MNQDSHIPFLDYIDWHFCSARSSNRVLSAKAGTREKRIHDIRPTYASLLLSQDESPVYVKKQLGRHGIQITVDICGHLIPSSNRSGINHLDSPQPSAPYRNQPKQKRRNT